MSELESQGYRVLGSIARGGMAEILLVERAGAAGIRKTLVLKRLLPDLARDPEFVRMFRNEARIAVGLQNANIVSVFEFGEADKQLFLAMEFVHGWELTKLLAASASGHPFPVEIALHITADVAKALAYAHDKVGDDGKPLGIVHRDVNPANVLVSTDGEVKLADFGIARAAFHATTNNGAWLKAKIPYMSPEQARAQTLDARSDLFSLGAVLFEMIAARRLHSGDDHAALLAAARKPVIPKLAGLRAEVPPAVEALVERALAVDRDKRFQSARDMLDALHAAMHTLRPGVSQSDVRRFVSTLELPPPVGAHNVQHGERTEIVTSVAVEGVGEAAGRGGDITAAPEIGRRGRSPVLYVVPALVLSFGVAGAVAHRDWGAPAQPESGRLEVRSPTPGARVFVDGVERGAAPVVLLNLPRRKVEVRVTAGHNEPTHREVRRQVDLAATPDVMLDVALDLH